jgi:[glutamine synthetase] adenylyltransferase / [glutamine synthetase]-adenylyl-L-tyrosine phosphorylase
MLTSFPATQLLDGTLPEYDAKTLLTSLGFRDWQAALRNLKHIAARDVGARPWLESILPHLFTILSESADPDQSLVNFERFASGTHTDEIFYKLKENPRALEILVTVFSGSQFLTEILVRNPRHLDVLTNREQLVRQKSAQDFCNEAMQWMNNPIPAEQLNDLRRYQRGELLRIGASDLLDLYDLPAVTTQLSNLADGLACACLRYASARSNTDPAGFVVLAMGKLGGSELNYSSDIDLLFLCANNGIDYLRLGQQFIDALANMTSEGFLYRVDMRLRPWGRDGALVSTIDGYLGYLNKSARLWEKQALLKARPISGNLALGENFLKQIEPLIYGENPETLRASVYAMKQRSEEILHAKGRDWGEVKLGEGSIRDVEFVVQYLQLVHGGANPKLRKKSTLQTLRRLSKYQLLTAHEARVLTDGYIFLRTIEHFLQMMHYHQTYTLPADPAAINLLARRLGFHLPEQFLERYQQHCQAIREVYSKYIMDIQPEPKVESAKPVFNPTLQHVARMDTSYAAAFSAIEISRHASLAEKLSEQQLVFVDAVPLEDGRWKVSVVAYDYLGELSLICGLMFVYGLDIQAGDVFTYETVEKTTAESDSAASSAIRSSAPQSTPERRKIVDVFTVQSVRPEVPDAAFWASYADDLHELLKMMHTGQRREARSKLATRVGEVFAGIESRDTPLYPIEISIDNDSSDRYTVLRIETADTVGFLYEFTNALSLTHIYIARMVVQSSGQRVDDLLYVNDESGKKITAPEKQRELRTAAVLIKHFTHLLPRSPNPATALLHFREFLAQLFARPGWPDELASLERPEVMDNLARLLGVSDFLWDDFMRMQYANLFPVVSDARALETAKSRTVLQLELEEVLATVHLGPQPLRNEAYWRKALNEFKDREMFRIDMRHILGHTKEFWDFSEELTDLTEVMINAAFHLTGEDLRAVYGTPRLPDGSISQMSVLALGKCGGRELGFASDIELMFVYAGEGRTDGSHPSAVSVFYEKVVQNFLKAIRARQEGIYQVDLQLRPYGKAGSLAVSLDSFKRYYVPTGPAWAYERQALVKMRPVAGDEKLGQFLSTLRDEFTYNGAPFDVTAMRAMRERQVRHLVSAGKFNAKYSPGGLVDIEYLIQGLQITHGAANPKLRRTNIRKAMAALNKAGILNDEDYANLHKAHTFLRWLIDSMRMVRGNAKDITVPAYGSEEFAFLARRLRYDNDVDRLRDDLLRYQTEVAEINRRLLK